jgi:hypothetical protein
MNVQIEVGGSVATFAMDEQQGSWFCARKLPQGDFPLIQVVSGKRYELYSDGTFAEVELGPKGRAERPRSTLEHR